ncbi:hypothetical protein G6F32_013865 [Rhizopus arrhizus]|nr:hypothetical protein G6F32_013865 [Rhizopus arrhizus]
MLRAGLGDVLMGMHAADPPLGNHEALPIVIAWGLHCHHRDFHLQRAFGNGRRCHLSGRHGAESAQREFVADMHIAHRLLGIGHRVAPGRACDGFHLRSLGVAREVQHALVAQLKVAIALALRSQAQHHPVAQRPERRERADVAAAIGIERGHQHDWRSRVQDRRCDASASDRRAGHGSSRVKRDGHCAPGKADDASACIELSAGPCMPQ